MILLILKQKEEIRLLSRRVIPMFPKEISNDVCSLIPNKEKACIVLEIEIKIQSINFNFHRAKIISVARLTYTS